jgi:hypothetical protein
LGRYVSKRSFVQLDRLVLIIKVLLFVTALSSCAPVPRDFHKPIYEGGDLISRGCGSSGPPEVIVIQLNNNVELKVRASSTNSNFYLSTSITAPDGVIFQLANDFIIIEDNLTNKKWNLEIEFVTTNQSNYFGSESSIIEITHPNLSQKLQTEIKNSRRESGYINVTTLSEIAGKTQSYDVAFGGKRFFNSGMSYQINTKDIESQLEDFSVNLPNIVVNGNKIDLGKIKFIHVKYMGIEPLNC